MHLQRPSEKLNAFLLWVLSVQLAMSAPLWSQPLPLSNASFEIGENTPIDWHLSTPENGRWLGPTEGFSQRAVTAIGDGTNTSYWHSDPIQFSPNQTYAMTFYSRSLGSERGSAISGPRFCNRDLGQIPKEWKRYRSIFTAPSQSNSAQSFLRFGQWKIQGEIAFDEVHIAPVQAVYSRHKDIVLGDGESIDEGHYTFRTPFHGPSGNHSRTLSAHSSIFNTNRWIFGPNSYVEYHHRVEGFPQRTAAVEVAVGHYESGRLLIEVSKDRDHYIPLGYIEKTQGATFPIPPMLLPSADLWIRLRSSADQPAAFQVVTYAYSARLDGNPPDLRGRTSFATLEHSPEALDVHLISLGQLRPGRSDSIALSVHSKLNKSLLLRPSLTLSTAGREGISRADSTVLIHPGKQVFSLPYTLQEIGSHTLNIGWDESPSYRAKVEFHIPALYAAQPGFLLPMRMADTALWQIDSGWKVDRNRPLPTREAKGLFLSAAGGEREAIQLVLSPNKPLKSLTVHKTVLTNASGDTLGREAIDVLQVAYVKITQPSDPLGTADLWPDPLLPLKGPIDLREGIHHPFWIRVHIPEETPSGLYEGALLMRHDNGEVSVPLTVEVYDFSLPHQMSCSTAFGFSFSNVIRYHNLSTLEDKRRVLALYLENFSAHRISPYDPAPLDPIRVSWKQTVPEFDWSAWDRSMKKAVGDYGFNSFRLPVPGLGSGDYTRQITPSLNGFSEGDPRYEEALQRYLSELERHLGEIGLLDEAYVYFFDEPRPADYPFVKRGFSKLARHAPALRRLLTEQVEEALVGGPTIWCPLTSHFQPHYSPERRERGDTYWWYICTQPKAPFAGLFIDRAGLELRTWLWQTWKRGIEGILIWQSNYWHSGAAYPHAEQNPYTDPMSWVSTYSAPKGTRRPWGNGDGRFIYPPQSAFNGSTTPLIQGPIDSQRWEMLRDGIEDYEYFSILRLLINGRKDLSKVEKERYESLLEVPEGVSISLQEFNRDPTPLRQHRRALARAIESLKSNDTE